MRKTYTFMRIIAATLIALAISAAQARAAVTVYADEVPSNAAVAASAPVVETNVPAAQTNLNAKSRSGGGNPEVRVDETGVHIGGPNPVDIDAPAWLQHGRGGHTVLGIVSVLSPFVMVVAIVALAGYFAHRRTKLAHETIRAMIEKGMPDHSRIGCGIEEQASPWHCAEPDAQERSFSWTGFGRNWRGPVDSGSRR